MRQLLTDRVRHTMETGMQALQEDFLRIIEHLRQNISAARAGADIPVEMPSLDSFGDPTPETLVGITDETLHAAFGAHLGAGITSLDREEVIGPAQLRAAVNLGPEPVTSQRANIVREPTISSHEVSSETAITEKSVGGLPREHMPGSDLDALDQWSQPQSSDWRDIHLDPSSLGSSWFDFQGPGINDDQIGS